MKATDQLRAVLEGKGYTVDTSLEPFGSVPGLVTAHLPGKNRLSSKLVINVRSRLLGYKEALRAVDSALVDRIAEGERCRKQKSDSD